MKTAFLFIWRGEARVLNKTKAMDKALALSWIMTIMETPHFYGVDNLLV